MIRKRTPIRKHIFAFVIFTFLFLFSFNNLLIAQNDSITDNRDNSYFFDDDNISTSKNIIKINVASAICGDASLMYERIIGSSFGIELGAGLILPYYVKDLPDLIDKDRKIRIEDPKSGYSWSICPKYYIQHRAPEYSYIGLQFKRRSYNLENGQNLVYDYVTFNTGAQALVGKRFILEYGLGVGFRLRNNRKIGEYDYVNISLPIIFRVGYLL